MATILCVTLHSPDNPSSFFRPQNTSLLRKPIKIQTHKPSNSTFLIQETHKKFSPIVSSKIEQEEPQEEVYSVGVYVALSILKFYKREISPLLPRSCRYVPTCSEYSMIAYKKYGAVKGTVLTGCRLCRCNPLGGSGFDPPRWFDEEAPPPE